jgi:hypothetical protein
MNRTAEAHPKLNKLPLYPEADTTLRDRLEALHAAVRPAGGVVIQFPQ